MSMVRRNFMLLNWHARFLKHALMYNAVVFLVFWLVYMLMDFDRHFTSAHPVTARGKLYFAIMTHTTQGTNDIVPKTDVARLVTAAHVIFAWVQLILVFYS